jgi:hypothetical protein
VDAVEDALGHFRPIDDVCAMSAFSPIATESLIQQRTKKAKRIHVRRNAGCDICAQRLTTPPAQYLDEAAALEAAQREQFGLLA